MLSRKPPAPRAGSTTVEHTRTYTAFALTGLVAAGLLAGCSTSTASEDPLTVTTTSTEPASTESTPTEAPKEACADPTMDLAETQFGLYLSDEALPSDPSPWTFEVEENQFDPCAQLSWVVLESKNDPGKALVFFHGEDMIRDQEPVVLPVADVIRVSDTQVKVGDTTYTLEGESLTVDNPSQGQTLSIATPPPAWEAITRYYGNVNGKPWDQELKPSGMYTYSIGEHNLLCGNPYEGRIMCQRGNFPHVNTMEQDGLIDDQSADVAMMSFSLPFYLETQYLPGGNMEGDGTLAPGTYRQGDLLIKYTGDTLTFTNGTVAYELGDGIARFNDDSPLLLDSTKASEYLRSIGG